jgi:hypothetical protein
VMNIDALDTNNTCDTTLRCLRQTRLFLRNISNLFFPKNSQS